MIALPTRRDEAWRYADLAALEALWPLPAPAAIMVPAGDTLSRAIASKGGVTQIELTLGKGASAAIHLLNGVGDYGRIELDVRLYEGADFTLDAVQLASGEQTMEIVTTVRHLEPNAKSRQTMRAIASVKGTVSYLGKVAVARGAQGTDSVQDVKSMLLDRTATANAKPELEIYADDVQCAHGATVGELDAGALFYLASRGLPPANAKKLMLQAFVAGVFDGAQDDETLTSAALAKLGEMV
ncbi:MAG: SufD family Fe-S cluster assembly protein [Sphingomonadales bacterium]|nr:SufD family Fe-S cluster assembly protein [Sphingomonadales bacterium]